MSYKAITDIIVLIRNIIQLTTKNKNSLLIITSSLIFLIKIQIYDLPCLFQLYWWVISLYMSRLSHRPVKYLAVKTYVRVSEGLGRHLVVIKWHGGGLKVLTAGLKEVITISTRAQIASLLIRCWCYNEAEDKFTQRQSSAPWDPFVLSPARPTLIHVWYHAEPLLYVRGDISGPSARTQALQRALSHLI